MVSVLATVCTAILSSVVEMTKAYFAGLLKLINDYFNKNSILVFLKLVSTMNTLQMKLT